MLSAWAILFYITTLLLCARLLRLRHCSWRVRVIIGGVVLYSLFQLGGLGGLLPAPMNGSDFVIGTLCVVMIFLMGESVLASRIGVLEPPLSEAVTHSSWKPTSKGRSASQEGVQREPVDRRGGPRRTIRVLASAQVINDPRRTVEGVIDNISAKGMRLRLTQALPLSSSVSVTSLHDTFFGIVRYCDPAPDHLEYYAGIEFDHDLASATLEKYCVEFSRPNAIEVGSEI